MSLALPRPHHADLRPLLAVWRFETDQLEVLELWSRGVGRVGQVLVGRGEDGALIATGLQTRGAPEVWTPELLEAFEDAAGARANGAPVVLLTPARALPELRRLLANALMGRDPEMRRSVALGLVSRARQPPHEVPRSQTVRLAEVAARDLVHGSGKRWEPLAAVFEAAGFGLLGAVESGSDAVRLVWMLGARTQAICAMPSVHSGWTLASREPYPA